MGSPDHVAEHSANHFVEHSANWVVLHLGQMYLFLFSELLQPVQWICIYAPFLKKIKLLCATNDTLNLTFSVLHIVKDEAVILCIPFFMDFLLFFKYSFLKM